jgi:signal transduction histidine kinase
LATNQSLNLANTSDNLSPNSDPSRLWRWWLPLFFIAWTLFAVCVATWLIHSAGAEPVQPRLLFDSSTTSQVPIGEQVRRWLQIADLNFRGAYPWVLLAPYVVWLTSRFLLERGRLRISLPVHLAACALFAAASYTLTAHVSEKMNLVVVVADRKENLPIPWDLLTNAPTANLDSTTFDGLPGTNNRGPHLAGVTKKVVVSAQGGMRDFELSVVTNEVTKSTNLARVRKFLTNWDSKALADLNPTLGENGSRQGFHSGAGSFSSIHSSWRYESRLFSQLLNILAYGSLVGLAHAVHFYGRYRERERRAALLESNLSRARLHALQAQLQPHFLFNALNAVATLLRRDARAAQEALTSFSELLRLALSQSDRQEVPLSEDMRFVERYVEIQQTRLGDRFRFEQSVEPAALDCLVPALLLQPLVENALRHGIEPLPRPGTVRVIVTRHSERLTLRVEDDGVGLEQSNGQSLTGIGLSNLRARLEALYGNRQKVEMSSRPEGGVAVRVEIPLREAAIEKGVDQSQKS